MIDNEAELPVIPENWVWTTVGNVYDIIGGGTPSTKVQEYWEGDIPWITSADIHGPKDIKARKYITLTAIEASATNLVPKGSLIVVTRVGLGKVAITESPVCFSQDNQALVLPNSLIDSFYSLYYLVLVTVVFKYKNRGTTIAGVTKKQLSDLAYPLAPLSEQHRIVDKLEEVFTQLDAGVQALNKVKTQLNSYRRAVLKHAFEGKLTAEWREKHKDELEPASILLERIKEERKKKSTGKLKERPLLNMTGLPVLPEEWVWTDLGQVTWSVKDGPHYSPKYTKDGIPFISGGNVRPSGVDFSSAKYISLKLHEELSGRCHPDIGDILYTKGGTTGIARVNTYDFEFNVWVHVAVLKLVDSIEPFYIQHALNSPFCYAQSQRFTHGVGNQDLGLTRMVNIVLSLPPALEQLQVITEIERLLSIADEIDNVIEKTLKQAERLRQSILKVAFEGKLVPQDPSDEPAEKLLERIKEDKAKQKITTKSAKSKEVK